MIGRRCNNIYNTKLDNALFNGDLIQMSVIRHQYDGQVCGKEWNEYVDSQTIPDKIACPCENVECVAELSFNWGKMNIVAGEQTFGVRYFKNAKTGNVIVAGTPFSQPPAGYTVETTTSYHGVQQLEKLVNAQAISESSYYREGLHQGYEAETQRIGQSVRDTTTSVIREEAVKMQQEHEVNNENVGYVPQLECPEARARFAKDVMIAHYENAPRKDFTAIDPGIKFEQLHTDAKKLATDE